jgi:surface antigen
VIENIPDTTPQERLPFKFSVYVLKGVISMEYNNDNGSHPEEVTYHVPPPVRHHTRSKVLLVLLGFIAGCVLTGSVMSAVVGFAVFSRVTSASPGSTAIHVEAISAIAGLSPVTAVSTIPVENVYQLNLTNRNGTIFVNVHDSPYIMMNVASVFSDGTVTVRERNTTIRLYIPHCDLDSAVSQININNRNGTIRIAGVEYGHSLLADNLNVENRNGAVFINDVALLDTLTVSTRNANVHLTNVLAPTEGVRLSSRNGRVFTN